MKTNIELQGVTYAVQQTDNLDALDTLALGRGMRYKVSDVAGTLPDFYGRYLFQVAQYMRDWKDSRFTITKLLQPNPAVTVFDVIADAA